MNRFARLVAALEAKPPPDAPTDALAAYFRTAPEPDIVRAIALLSGRRPKRAATTAELRHWATDEAGLPDWLFAESLALVGDLAETIAHILPPATGTAIPTLADTLAALARLPGQPEQARRAAIAGTWGLLPPPERLIYTRLLTGGFRMTVSRGQIARALAHATGATGADETNIAHRLIGAFDPATARLADLTGDTDTPKATADARPYPFALAAPLQTAPQGLGPPGDWLAEWLWDGIRAQLIARAGAFALWSREGEPITDRFPECAPLRDALPQGTVIDAAILAWDPASGRPLDPAMLHPRLARRTLPKSLLAKAPARLMAFDLLEQDGTDLRALPLADRRARLGRLIAALPPGLPLAASPLLPPPDWTAPDGTAPPDWATLTTLRDSARDHGAAGLMLKRAASPYVAGRQHGDWRAWRLPPRTVTAVLLYAQTGPGAAPFTDFTFALRDGDDLVPIAKALSGLTDAEYAQIARWVQAHTLTRFGPVRQVPPDLVFDLAFDGIQPSPRHKSGIALRAPRILRWHRDAGAATIDTLASLRALLPAQSG
ncbi:MAG: cisplatin damage response ATP-dependent DNA ligase [Paracoccaceae bacterium]